MHEAARRKAMSGIVKRKSVSKTRAYIYITTAMVIWATSFLVTQEALKAFTPVMTVTMRIGLATLILLVVGLASGNLQKLESRRDALTLLCAGFCQPFCYFVCEAYGLSMINAAVASVILSTIPLFSPLLAYFIIGERVSWYNLAGIVVSFVGVAMVVMEGQHLAVEPIGLAVLMLAVLSAVMYTIFLKQVPVKYSSTTTIFYVHLSSMIFFLPTFFIVDGGRLGDIEFSWRAFGCVVLLAALASVLGYVLFCKVIRVIGVTKSNAFNNIQPAITALAVWLIFGERLAWSRMAGIVLVIAGLFVSQMQVKVGQVDRPAGEKERHNQ